MNLTQKFQLSAKLQRSFMIIVTRIKFTKMKKLIAFQLVCFVVNIVFVDAQAPALQWQKAFAVQGNSDAYSIQKTTMGDILLQVKQEEVMVKLISW